MTMRTLNVWWDGQQVGQLTQNSHGELGFAYPPLNGVSVAGRLTLSENDILSLGVLRDILQKAGSERSLAAASVDFHQ